MASIQINSKMKVGLEDLLKGFSELETQDIEYFMMEVANLVAKRKAPNFNKRETELLLAINNSCPPEKMKKIKFLKAKLQEETISEKEHKIYLKLLEESEERSVKRLENLIELAQLRKVSLNTLMNQLGLNPTPSA